jgi:hypothetical protein
LEKQDKGKGFGSFAARSGRQIKYAGGMDVRRIPCRRRCLGASEVKSGRRWCLVCSGGCCRDDVVWGYDGSALRTDPQRIAKVPLN